MIAWAMGHRPWLETGRGVQSRYGQVCGKTAAPARCQPARING
jgi:hypothetical protein